jgi:hypothetical protein
MGPLAARERAIFIGHGFRQCLESIGLSGEPLPTAAQLSTDSRLLEAGIEQKLFSADDAIELAPILDQSAEHSKLQVTTIWN